MAVTPKAIHQQGNQLLLVNSDGSKTPFLHAGKLYLPQSTSTTVIAPPTTDPVTGGVNGFAIVSPLPMSITGTCVDGTVYTFDSTQISRMVECLNASFGQFGVNADALKIMLTVPVVESSWRNLSNVTAWPGSDSYPEIDGDGSNGRSLGLFQQTPPYWGTPQDDTTPSFEAQAFLGGSSGPSASSAPGLFDLVPTWSSQAPGVAAQNVQVSAYPDRYTNAYPVGEAIYAALVTEAESSGTQPAPGTPNTIDSDTVYSGMLANPTNTPGYCLEYWDHLARLASTMGNFGGGLPTANSAAAKTPGIAQTPIPDAGFVWFDDPSGDVGFIYKGTCYFTDSTENGVVGPRTVEERLAALQYLHGTNNASFTGYSDNYLGWPFTEPSS